VQRLRRDIEAATGLLLCFLLLWFGAVPASPAGRGAVLHSNIRLRAWSRFSVQTQIAATAVEAMTAESSQSLAEGAKGVSRRPHCHKQAAGEHQFSDHCFLLEPIDSGSLSVYDL
jgi:hypothetical protein